MDHIVTGLRWFGVIHQILVTHGTSEALLTKASDAANVHLAIGATKLRRNVLHVVKSKLLA